ncbi:hypothetical protein QYF36_001841 [Acer negundo]|nr:hypothetical protein QYF36_001841 [Acer negundo]
MRWSSAVTVSRKWSICFDGNTLVLSRLAIFAPLNSAIFIVAVRQSCDRRFRSSAVGPTSSTKRGRNGQHCRRAASFVFLAVLSSASGYKVCQPSRKQECFEAEERRCLHGVGVLFEEGQRIGKVDRATKMVIAGSNPHNKEIAIRRRIASIYNKREDDFPSLREYNDYLEEVEDMIFNLIEGVDVQAIEEKIKQYQKENAEQIIVNQARKAEELAAALTASKAGPAQNDTDGAPSQSSQGGFGVPLGQYAPTMAGGQPRPTGMGPQPLPLSGGLDMHGYAIEDEEMMKLRAERGGKAGGWSTELSKKRALEEAFASIWV